MFIMCESLGEYQVASVTRIARRIYDVLIWTQANCYDRRTMQEIAGDCCTLSTIFIALTHSL